MKYAAFHTVLFESVAMELERETKPQYSSVEEVIALWKTRLGDEWVNEILAMPNVEQKVMDFAERTGRTLPDAWSSYLSSMILSQI